VTAVPAPAAAPPNQPAPARTSPPSGHALRRWLPGALLVVVVAVALAVGSQRHIHRTIQQQTMSIAGAVRCPVCTGETAAESNTPISIEIRKIIRQDLQRGDSRSQVLDQLVASFGPSELEAPPAKGINIFLWVLPGLAVIAALAGLVLLFRRWRPAHRAPVTDEDRRLVRSQLDPVTGGPAPPEAPT
jgi:cytochrome c-type biogenesis protein CcmH